MTEKLKPCPFCGEKVTIITNAHSLEECSNFDYDNCPCNEYASNSCSYHTIVCNANNNGCGASSGYYSTIEEAINAWNTRADERPKGEWRKNIKYDLLNGMYQCSNCGHVEDIATGKETPLDRGFLFCPNCGADMRKEN